MAAITPTRLLPRATNAMEAVNVRLVMAVDIIRIRYVQTAQAGTEVAGYATVLAVYKSEIKEKPQKENARICGFFPAKRQGSTKNKKIFKKVLTMLEKFDMIYERLTDKPSKKGGQAATGP